MPWFCSQIWRRLAGVNRFALPSAICWLRVTKSCIRCW